MMSEQTPLLTEMDGFEGNTGVIYYYQQTGMG